jgi:hypothetical protein
MQAAFQPAQTTAVPKHCKTASPTDSFPCHEFGCSDLTVLCILWLVKMLRSMTSGVCSCVVQMFTQVVPKGRTKMEKWSDDEYGDSNFALDTCSPGPAGLNAHNSEYLQHWTPAALDLHLWACSSGLTALDTYSSGIALQLWIYL